MEGVKPEVEGKNLVTYIQFGNAVYGLYADPTSEFSLQIHKDEFQPNVPVIDYSYIEVPEYGIPTFRVYNGDAFELTPQEQLVVYPDPQSSYRYPYLQYPDQSPPIETTAERALFSLAHAQQTFLPLPNYLGEYETVSAVHTVMQDKLGIPHILFFHDAYSLRTPSQYSSLLQKLSDSLLKLRGFVSNSDLEESLPQESSALARLKSKLLRTANTTNRRISGVPKFPSSSRDFAQLQLYAKALYSYLYPDACSDLSSVTGFYESEQSKVKLTLVEKLEPPQRIICISNGYALVSDVAGNSLLVNFGAKKRPKRIKVPGDQPVQQIHEDASNVYMLQNRTILVYNKSMGITQPDLYLRREITSMHFPPGGNKGFVLSDIDARYSRFDAMVPYDHNLLIANAHRLLTKDVNFFADHRVPWEYKHFLAINPKQLFALYNGRLVILTLEKNYSDSPFYTNHPNNYGVLEKLITADDLLVLQHTYESNSEELFPGFKHGVTLFNHNNLKEACRLSFGLVAESELSMSSCGNNVIFASRVKYNGIYSNNVQIISMPTDLLKSIFRTCIENGKITLPFDEIIRVDGVKNYEIPIPSEELSTNQKGLTLTSLANGQNMLYVGNSVFRLTL